MNREPHGEPGHVNIYVRDHDDVITGFGAHDRVIAFCPAGDELYLRVDKKWRLGMPSESQMLAVARTQSANGRWEFYGMETHEGGESIDVYFRRARVQRDEVQS